YEVVANKGQCVFPEMSRVYHFGIGVNSINLWMWEKFVHSSPLVTEAYITLDNTSLLTNALWHNRTSEAIRGAKMITRNPCVNNFLPDDPEQDTNFVFYYLQRRNPNGTTDYYDFYWARKCLNIWSLNDQGMYNTILPIRFSKHGTLYMVGVPYSQYAHLRPRGTPVWAVDTNTEEEEKSLVSIIKEHELGDDQYQVYGFKEEQLMNTLSEIDPLL
ncbi:unnamed protein product, partial [Meganyctiphanes norvegica]